jgi:hypothetical protein
MEAEKHPVKLVILAYAMPCEPFSEVANFGESEVVKPSGRVTQSVVAGVNLVAKVGVEPTR